MTNGEVLSNKTVVITGETITEITDGGPPPGSQQVQGQGKFLIPGLWDMHAHIQGNEKGWLPLYVANGVTGIRDMGADLNFILSIREAVATNRLRIEPMKARCQCAVTNTGIGYKTLKIDVSDVNARMPSSTPVH